MTDSSSGQLIFASSCVAFSLYCSLKRSQEQDKRKGAESTLPTPVFSPCDTSKGDITLHHIQSLSDYVLSQNVSNSSDYFHVLKSDDYVMGKNKTFKINILINNHLGSGMHFARLIFISVID
jgi:hypothetical protein